MAGTCNKSNLQTPSSTQLDLLPTNNNKLRKEIAELDLFSLASRFTTSHKEMVIKERLGPADRSERRPH